MKKAYLNWSSGKDSALTLYQCLLSEEFSVKALFSTLKHDSAKIAMHEIKLDLLKKRAGAIGIRLVPFYFDASWSEAKYEQAMMKSINEFQKQNITTALFGDLHLESIRKKREEKCNRSGIEAAFPLWGKSPESVLSEFIESGFKAIVTCIDTSVLPEEFIGRVIDNDFLSELPPNADICGENGEYHSFVFDGPVFKHPVKFTAKRTYDKTYLNRQTNTFHRYRYLELE